MPIGKDPLCYSIVKELKGRWAPTHLASPRMNEVEWRRVLLEMRAFWEMGRETILETRFYKALQLLPGNGLHETFM